MVTNMLGTKGKSLCDRPPVRQHDGQVRAGSVATTPKSEGPMLDPIGHWCLPEVVMNQE